MVACAAGREAATGANGAKHVIPTREDAGASRKTQAAGRCPAAVSRSIAISPPGRRLFPARRLALLLRLGLLLGFEVLAGLLIDHLHRQPHLAALVEAQKLHLDLVALVDHVVHLLDAA